MSQALRIFATGNCPASAKGAQVVSILVPCREYIEDFVEITSTSTYWCLLAVVNASDSLEELTSTGMEAEATVIIVADNTAADVRQRYTVVKLPYKKS